MFTFTKDIERFAASGIKHFEVVIGQVNNGMPGLSIKIFTTSKVVNYAMDLISQENGDIYEGNYKDRKIYCISYGYKSCHKNGELHLV